MSVLRMASPFKHPRSGVFYIRRAVPRDIQEALGRREYLKSLGTKDPKVAKQLFPAALQECEAVFARARAGMAPLDHLDDQQIQDIAAAWAAHVMEEDEEHRLDGLSEREYERMQETFDIVLPTLKYDLARGAIGNSAYEFDDFLKSYGYNIPPSSPTYRRVHMAMLRSWVRTLELQQKRHQGEPIDTPKAPEIGPRRLLDGAGADVSRLSGAFEGWRRERMPTERVWLEWSLALRRFVEVNGDVPVSQLNRVHIRKFKDKLLELGLSTASVQKHLTAIRSVLAWAVDNGLCEHNVAAGVKIREARMQPARRLPYDDKDLEILFSSTIYTQGFRPRGGGAGGEAAFWLPLLALYTGCRLEELGQALVSDVVTLDGVTCLSINDVDAGKQLKTASSRRIVPIHPELLRLGFSSYVACVSGEVHLFSDLKVSRYGKRTVEFSKWWGRWARKLGIGDERKVFHSFRHTFKAACRRAGIDEEKHDLLTGHQGGGIGRTYGRGEARGADMVRVLFEEIGKVKYLADLAAVPVWTPKHSGTEG